MTTKLSYEGDGILPERQSRDDMKASNVTCLIWGADLTSTNRRRQVRQVLREHAMAAFAATRAHAALRHLIVAYRCAPHLRDRLQITAYSESRRVHAALELKRARDIDVIMIDVTGLADNHLAEQRFNELAGKRAGVAGYTAISWNDIRHPSIQVAGAQDIV